MHWKIVESVRKNEGVNFEQLAEFLGLFRGNQQNVGACFTLNQDLFFEIPKNGLNEDLIWQSFVPIGYEYKRDTKGDIDLNSKIVLPNDKFTHPTINNETRFCYMKLHGSLNWRSSEDRSRIVMGDANYKIEQIQAEPLLDFYINQFQGAINSGKVQLLVIGYGFRDRHINKFLLKAVNEHELNIHIISTTNEEKFKEILKSTSKEIFWDEDNRDEQSGTKLCGAIKGYYPYRMNAIFPKNESKTNTAVTLTKIFSS